MNTKFASHSSLVVVSLMASSSVAIAQSSPANSGANKPMVIDAAVVDNRYQLYEGEVIKIEKRLEPLLLRTKKVNPSLLQVQKLRILIKSKKAIKSM